MARHAFFSFHYQNDIWRASQVRNAWVTQDRDTAEFWDAADWEKVKRGGENAIERWIENQLDGTSVTEYDWVANDGYENFADWIEKAARDAGR